MKQLLIALVATFVVAGFTLSDADAARRLGGGASSGMQRSLPAKRDAAPSQSAPTAPAQPATPASGNRWLGPIAGLAAGIGLAALASHFGFSEELASFAMIALIVMAVFFVIRLLARRAQPQERPHYAGPAGAFERKAPVMEEDVNSRQTPYATSFSVPPDFDTDSFVRHAKLNFVRLQAANDAGDIEDIRQFTTPEMFAEIKLQMQERPTTPQKTDVVSLNAELLDFNTEFRQQIASVRFWGTIRETPGGSAESFDEVWHIAKPVDGSRNWAIAGIQQSH